MQSACIPYISVSIAECSSYLHWLWNPITLLEF